jgi:hypothetical protein
VPLKHDPGIFAAHYVAGCWQIIAPNHDPHLPPYLRVDAVDMNSISRRQMPPSYRRPHR